MMAISIDPEFQTLIAPLQPEEREQLEANLAAHGCRDPLAVWRGLLIDGHNRHEICERRKISYRTIEVALTSREHVLLWIEENQLGRRNLTDDQRAVIARAVQKRRAALAKIERGKQGGRGHKKVVGNSDLQLPKAAPSRPAVAKKARVSERKLRLVAEIEKKNPAALAAVRAGEKTLAKALREVRTDERAARRVIPVGAVLPTDCELHQGDLSEVEIVSASVDAIVTDPPYPKEFLPVYRKLAVLALHCLKPGGSLLVMVGQSYLPDLLKALCVDDSLTYHWTLAYLTPGGQAPQIWARKVNTFWKPVLWFVKGQYAGDWIGDVVKTPINANDKRYHEWGQSEMGLASLVERFTLPGQTILDPFLGGGTTATVALKLGRRFIGIDSDCAAIETTKARLSA